MAESSERELTPDEASYVTAARQRGFVLHEGVAPMAVAIDPAAPAVSAANGGSSAGSSAGGGARGA